MTQLILARDAQRIGTSAELRRQIDAGLLTRIGVGVFVRTTAWDAMDLDSRYITRVKGASLISSRGAQFSHDSAAALWRLPSIGQWPEVAHELTGRAAGGASRVGIRRHALGLDASPIEIDGVNVTSLARTVVDMACTTSFARAVAMADAALEARSAKPRTTGLQLSNELELLNPYRGLVRARQVVEFATDLSQSPGESLARAQFRALGYPMPELQVEVFDELGLIGVVDFYWPHLGLICEFDGLSKYGIRRLYQLGMSVEQIVVDEKLREDRMRRVSNGFARINWEKSRDRRVLAAYLAPYGLVERRRRPS